MRKSVTEPRWDFWLFSLWPNDTPCSFGGPFRSCEETFSLAQCPLCWSDPDPKTYILHINAPLTPTHTQTHTGGTSVNCFFLDFFCFFLFFFFHFFCRLFTIQFLRCKSKRFRNFRLSKSVWYSFNGNRPYWWYIDVTQTKFPLVILLFFLHLSLAWCVFFAAFASFSLAFSLIQPFFFFLLSCPPPSATLPMASSSLIFADTSHRQNWILFLVLVVSKYFCLLVWLFPFFYRCLLPFLPALAVCLIRFSRVMMNYRCSTNFSQCGRNLGTDLLKLMKFWYCKNFTLKASFGDQQTNTMGIEYFINGTDIWNQLNLLFSISNILRLKCFQPKNIDICCWDGLFGCMCVCMCVCVYVCLCWVLSVMMVQL